MRKEPLRILIADDHAIFRDGLRRLLESEPGFSVCGEAADGHQALKSIAELRPDLLLLDLAMAGLPGLEVLTRLPAQSNPPRTIVLTAAIDPMQMARALQLGAAGIVLKESATRVLFDSIQCVIDGGHWVAEGPIQDVAETVKTLSGNDRSRQPAGGYGLTSREIQIVAGVLDGETNKEMAARFSISEHTVKNHLSSIFSKLGVSSRLELGLLAQGKGLSGIAPVRRPED